MKLIALTFALAISGASHASALADFLEPIEISVGKSPEIAEKQMREFVWSHWKARGRRGFIQATFYSKEGERSQTNAVVGPEGMQFGKSGPPPKWRLAVTILREFSEPTSFTAYEMELGPSKYDSKRIVLILKDKSGTVLTEW